MLPGVLHPCGDVVECVPAGDVVDEERPGRPAVVGAGDGAERLLPGRVPDLELDLLPLDVDHAGAELHAYGQVVHGLEPLVRELQQQARLAHAWKTRKSFRTWGFFFNLLAAYFSRGNK